MIAILVIVIATMKVVKKIGSDIMNIKKGNAFAIKGEGEKYAEVTKITREHIDKIYRLVEIE